VGGLYQLAKTVLKSFNPYNYLEKYNNLRHNIKKSSENLLNDQDRQYARLAQQAYQSKDNRKNIGDYKYIKDSSGEFHAVYHHPNEKIISFKGTSSKKDLIPDGSILAGIQDMDNRHKTLLNTSKEIILKDPGNYRFVGHSLGASNSAFAGQNLNIPTHNFNIGYNALTDDRINTDYNNHNFYFVNGDPISNSMLSHKLPNVKILPSASYYNPIKNHTIKNFI
jgi:hypothetical protein